MSHNQARAEKSEVQVRRPGRSGSSSQQRGYAGGGGNGGGVAGPPPSSPASTASLFANRSFKKSSQGQGGHSRMGGASLNSEPNVGVPNTRITQNGAYTQSQLHDAPAQGGAKPIDLAAAKSSRALPRAPSSQPTSGASDVPTPRTPSKGDVSKPFSLQFGSISPVLMNGMQIPARTSSAPPNLDEQKRDQARRDSSKTVPTMPVPSAHRMQQMKKDVGSTNQPTIAESRPPSQAKRDVQVHIPATPATTQKSTPIPIAGMSMPPMPYQQSQMPLQFGAPSAQMQPQGVNTSSLQMPMALPVGTTAQVQQFVPGLQSHPLPPQGMMHQGQGLGFAPQMGHQLGNLGISMTSPFGPQQHSKFPIARKTVKITDPKTHEEVKLDKMTDSVSDVGSSGLRSHPNPAPQSQPIQSFSPAHSINYFPTGQPSSYNFFSNPTSVPLTSTQVTPGSSAARYNYPVGQGGPSISFMNPSALEPSSVSKAGPPMHGVTEPSNLEHTCDEHMVSATPPSASVRVAVMPTVKPPAEKVTTSVSVSSSVSKVESPKLLRQPSETSASNRQIDNDVGSDSCLKPSKFLSETLGSMSLPAANNHSTHTPASISMHGLPSSTTSVSASPAEESAAAVTKADGQRREPIRRSDSLKDQQRKPKKELRHSQQQHQVDSVDSAGSLKPPLLKLPRDNSSSDLNVAQPSKNHENVQGPLETVGEPSPAVGTPPPSLKSNVFSSSESEKGEEIPSLENSGSSSEASAEISQVAQASCCDASTTKSDGVLNVEGHTHEPFSPWGLDAGKSNVVLLTDRDGFASLDVGLKQETIVKDDRATGIPDKSSQDFSNIEVPTGRESTVDKETQVVSDHVASSDKAEETNIFAISKLTDVNAALRSEIGRTVDSLVRSSSSSSGPIDGTTAPIGHMPSADASREKASSTNSPKTESEKNTNGQEVTSSGSGILSRETTTAFPSSSSQMTRKHDERMVESTSSGQASTSLLMEQNRIKNATGRRRKMKEIFKKAWTPPDLYEAYKNQEKNDETSITSEIIDSSAADVNHADVESDTVVVEDDGQNKSELDDWEDAAEIPTPKLKPSENGELVHGATKHDEYGGGVAGRKKYTRDFLLTFVGQFSDLPAGFEIGSDMVDALMSGPVAPSHLVDRDSYTSSGRIIDRQTGGSRNDRRGSGIIDDDKWVKALSSFASGRDPRVDVTHGGMPVNFRPGQGGNHGVLRNPRGQSSGQYAGGILSGPMQGLSSPGGMARSSPDMDRWQRAKGLIPAPPPLQVMHKAEKKYEVGKVSDKEEAKQRQLKAILNKLTPQNFDKLFEQVKEVNIDNTVTLTGVISQIFDKALMEPTFCEMYADFCFHLAGALPDFSEDNEKITFKRWLLNKCQEEFERGEREQAEANKVEEEGEIRQSDEEREQKKIKARRRMLGNIRLIGELYKKKMLTERIMHECIKKLLGQYQNPDEEDVEALCKLMSTIGEIIDHPKAKEHIDVYFDVMQKLSNNQKLSSRVRFMLKDAIDLRKNKWQQRRKIEGPKKIEEVHRDAAQERQLQTSRLSRGGPGISSARRGPPMDYGPRGPTAFSSSSAQQMSAPRSLQPQIRGYGTQDVRLEDRHSHESRMLSVLPQRPVDDESITLGPQGGLARGMSIRGQPLMPSAPLVDVPPTTGDTRRTVSGLNGYNPPDWAPYSPREEPMPRYMPDRFQESPAYDQSNSLERNRSFGSRDVRNLDRPFDRSMTASPASGRVQGYSYGAYNVPPEPKLSEDQLRTKSISAIREYYSARNEDEVRLCIKELNSPSFYPDMVMLWVTDSFDRKNDIDRELLAKLLVNLCKSRDAVLSQAQLIKGFEAVLSTLEDAITDSPKAAEYLGCVLGKIISENVIPFRDIGRIIHDGGEERGCLLETGLASDLLVTIFELIKRDKGESTLNEMWMSSNLRLDDFRHSDPTKSRRLEAFI